MSPFDKSILLITFLLLYVPVSSTSTNQTDSEPSFVPDPPGRGTISLLTTCVVTLSLCVWTAIHMNIEPPNQSRLRKALNKLCWAVLALVAPEIVLWRAYTQWKSARKLCNLINALPQRARPSSLWTIENGFFAVMGGYRIREMKGWPDGCTLTPLGVYLLARLKSLPEVDKESILDRSKADELVKGLACCQAVWLVIQVIARKASGLPVTLLELNTVAHVVCAILMYTVWWHKPQNVNQPEFVNVDPGLEVLLSSSLLEFRGQVEILLNNDSQRTRGLMENGDTCVGTEQPSEQRFGDVEIDGDLREAMPKNESGIRVTRSTYSRFLWKPLVDVVKERVKSDGIVMLLPGQRLAGSLYTALDVMHLTTADVQEIKLISEIRGLEFLDKPLEIQPSGPIWFNKYWTYPGVRHVSARASNIIIEGDVIDQNLTTNLWPLSFGKSLPMLAILSIFYGGIHATAWNSHFPTAIEQHLWRIASSVVAGGGLVLWVANFFHEAWRLRAVVTFTSILLGAIILSIFTAARFYLFIESFISIRSLPIGAFTSVEWVNFLPHVG